MSSIIECPHCGKKNRIPDPPVDMGEYNCGSCKKPLKSRESRNENPAKGPNEVHARDEMPHRDLVRDFIKALDEEIKAIKDGKGGSVTRVFDGRLIRETSGVFVYSFVLENFLATIDDAPVEVQVSNSRYTGQVIQTQGLEIIIGIEQDLGPTIPEARVITNLYFLHEMLKKKLEAAAVDSDSGNFQLATQVFFGLVATAARSVSLPTLEPHPRKTPNASQLEAIKLSLGLPLTLVWGPPGTGKTETLARIVECFAKGGKRVLVVAHANAAVDEATEDIAEILKTTELYNRGRIIRLGNYQKTNLETDYPLVILDRVAESLGATLKQEREELEKRKNKIEKDLGAVEAAVSASRELQDLSLKIQQLENSLNSVRGEEASANSRAASLENDLEGLRRKLREAESLGTVGRLLRGLNPAKMQHEIDQSTIRLDSIRSQSLALKSRRADIEQQKAQADAHLSEARRKLELELQKLRVAESKLRSFEQELSAERNKILSRIGEIQKELDDLKKRVLSESMVICTTLTKTFSSRDFPGTPFDVLIVDEASMAPMPHLYWALGRCHQSAVVVGDFLQLPPICISDEATAHKWLGRSIYEHLGVETVSKAKRDNRVQLLDRQYRMNPAISFIPNQLFYQGLLSDDSSTTRRIISEGLSPNPLTLVDTTSASPWCSHLSAGGRFNVYSALLATTIAQKILEGNNPDETQVGIIAPYNAQVRLIGKLLKDMGLERKIRVATVHRFQGGESEIVILDTVEGPGVRVSPMLDNTKKNSTADLVLNVALTRAKCKIFLLANVGYLQRELSSETHLYRVISEFERNGYTIDSDSLVDSYFMRDFERVIQQFIESSKTGLVEPPSSSVFSERNFYPVFFHDLQSAQKEVIIFSPFVSIRRSSQFVELFRILSNRGIKIRLFTRPPAEQTGNMSIDAAHVLEHMKSIGVEVTERKRLHEKIGIIDRSIAWEGSLNILSHRDSSEQMRRLPFATTANELIRLLELEDARGTSGQAAGEPIKTSEACPLCGEKMVIRRGRYGAFLSCENYPSCKGTHKIRKWDKIETLKLCPECGKFMILREGTRGPFLGCSGYPQCRKTITV
jgi:superfamily I DNA and/or RNA helicase/ssDNA-binding Zn-finger/Zn-ribbon topoisomerase 1